MAYDKCSEPEFAHFLDMARKLLLFQERLLMLGGKPIATIAFHCLCASVYVYLYIGMQTASLEETLYGECHFAFCKVGDVCIGRIYPHQSNPSRFIVDCRLTTKKK